MNSTQHPVIVWFRQDLRVLDNAALNAAIETGQTIIPLYIDEEDRGTNSYTWLQGTLFALSNELKKMSLNLIIRKGKPFDVLSKLIAETHADKLYWNRCYEPKRIKADSFIKAELSSKQFAVQSFKGNLFFEPWEISTKLGKPFQVFTPFYNACLKSEIKKSEPLPDLKIHGYNKKIATDDVIESKQPRGKDILNHFLQSNILLYDQIRDRPDLNQVSHLSPFLHFGELSPIMVYEAALALNKNDNAGVQCFIKQLFWREFGYHLLYHFPKTVNEPLNKKFDNFPWKNDRDELKAWEMGMTGYPLVDAGMRQLLATGWMHNRVRMVVGSFLVKDLLIPWQLGAAWFMEKLNDADLANNTLGWQWVAGCGADAAPFFRIFNPTTQAERFDPEGLYIKKWVPELKNLNSKWIHKPFMAPLDVLRAAGIELGKTYPVPMVDHDVARKEALVILKNLGDNE